jgi:hypothetical protein
MPLVFYLMDSLSGEGVNNGLQPQQTKFVVHVGTGLLYFSLRVPWILFSDGFSSGGCVRLVSRSGGSLTSSTTSALNLCLRLRHADHALRYLSFMQGTPHSFRHIVSLTSLQRNKISLGLPVLTLLILQSLTPLPLVSPF